jgi:glycosyltransferase involved in cell wall biosynthesis
MSDDLPSTRISVITCSHNPRLDYLNRVISALSSQSLERHRWEYLLIDNASITPLSTCIDLSWHPFAKHIREDQLGLTSARLRGIAEATGNILVFVDDDNVLDDEFLKIAKNIGKTYPFLGAWGGPIIAEFEVPPPEWTRPHWPNLAIRDFDVIRWSNTFDDWKAQPCGAGLCIRARIAQHYAHGVTVNPLRRQLDRKGERLTGSGDTDLIYTSQELGLGWGTFPNLKLKHLMPKERLTEPYLLRLAEGTAETATALRVNRGEPIALTPTWKVALRFLWILVTNGPREARFYLARKRGTARGLTWTSSA